MLRFTKITYILPIVLQLYKQLAKCLGSSRSLVSANGSASGRMVVNIDASTIIAARGNFHEVQINSKSQYGWVVHLHDEWLFSVVGIADGEMANV